MNNKLYTSSFEYRNMGRDIDEMHVELNDLIEVISYCEGISEPMQFDEEIWDCVVDGDGKLLAEWLFGDNTKISEDVRRFFTEFFVKSSRTQEDENIILCGLVKIDDVVTCLNEYLSVRREHLNSIDDPEAYLTYSYTCFPNLLFSIECNEGIKRIERFSQVKREISQVLLGLNDKASVIYIESNNDSIEASKRMTSTIGRTCSTDPGNMDKLYFSFINKDKRVRICCHTHVKLIRDDSNYRIYFWWNGEKLEEGAKTLVGWIDGHPY